ncbi:DNA topoisomerase IV subunit B [Candidatus Pacearchaeota archaeon ex4484_26]|nr:MAG: DNA topoisomerase IV subunit B [Candidatus Pacearchaeota archaeon ex4484_26]
MKNLKETFRKSFIKKEYKRMAKQEYGVETIKVLKGLDGVRKRPSMYIGSTGKEGLHHLIYEVVDNAIDEALAGYCTKIEIILHADGSVSVKDNGRGIPVEKHPEVKKSGLEVVMTMLHAGGKFDKKAYLISGGLHGVGVSVVNALSEKLIAQVKRNGKIYEQTYKRGRAQNAIKVIGKSKETGTTIRFWPDKEIFNTLKYDFSTLITRFRELAFLNSGLTIVLKEEKTKKKQEFHFKGGIIAFIQYLNNGRKTLHKPIYFHKSEKESVVEIAIQYNDSYTENIHGFVNTINTIEGGTHVVGFKTALTRVINDYAVKNNLLKGNGKLTGDDVREGLTVVINLKIKEPQFEGQTKTKLGNSEVKGFVNSVTTTALSEYFEENPSVARKIISKVVEALKAREAAKKAKELVRRKGALSFGNLPGKLADCISNKLEESELFIVEGDSAGGSAKQARDKRTQAILPIRGKILNVGKENIYVYNDNELKKYTGKSEVQRFKGLGEMNPEQLWETTMNAKKRMLRKITIEDAAEADRIFSILMGSEVEPRKKFIEENAKLAELDV